MLITECTSTERCAAGQLERCAADEDEGRQNTPRCTDSELAYTVHHNSETLQSSCGISQQNFPFYSTVASVAP